jgi:hypothetical protein
VAAAVCCTTGHSRAAGARNRDAVRLHHPATLFHPTADLPAATLGPTCSAAAQTAVPGARFSRLARPLGRIGPLISGAPLSP